MPKVTYNYIRKLDIASLGKMSKKEVVQLLNQVRHTFNIRQGQLEKVKKNVYSPALEKMEEYYEENGATPVSKISRNKAINEIARIQEFFNAKTSSVKGAREVMRQQDIRIYGKNELGNPVHRMTVEKRAKYWSVYDEFLSTYKNAEAIFGSDKIQQFLGERVTKKKGKFIKDGISADELQAIFDNLTANLEDEEDGQFRGNVYSGRGDDY